MIMAVITLVEVGLLVAGFIGGMVFMFLNRWDAATACFVMAGFIVLADLANHVRAKR